MTAADATVTTTGSSVVVVPCFNEAHRLDQTLVHELVERSGAHVLVVDDGSTDGTTALLSALAADSQGTISCHRLATNRGKAEAVRRGLRLALDRGASLVGFCDADFATPPAEVARLYALVEANPGVDVAIASRVAMLGADVRRSVARHYLGRLFATAASVALGMTVYDTQCGAKVFRRTPALGAALSTPLRSDWAFDVELLARLRRGDGCTPGLGIDRFLEVPLRTWHDIAGSKLTTVGAARALLDVIRIGLRRRSGRCRF